ncbi:Actin family [Trinorchestia longiramus]|nr:Actin family [Trinorchestia longiramus]
MVDNVCINYEEVDSMEDLTACKVYKFTDARTQPDPIHPYTHDLHGIPIVIDNGSYHCRVGWATDDEPRLQFRNCYAKHRKDRGKKMPASMELLVGNDITNIEAVRFQLKTAHDENVVTHFQAQELLLNYSFSHLGITDSSGVQHPVVMTEPLLNPPYCRGLMSELLFECYNIPRVAYCVDGLANYYHNQGMSPTAWMVLLITTTTKHPPTSSTPPQTQSQSSCDCVPTPAQVTTINPHAIVHQFR